MEESEFYYQTRSGTRFQSVEPDPEDVGLENYRQAEVTAALDFLRSDNRVLAMGGISSTGKTFTLYNLAKDQGLDFLDSQSVAGLGEMVDDIGLETVVGKMLDKRDVRSEEPKALVLDEGMSLLARGKPDEIIRKLLDRYPHLIIAGGGEDMTGEEQTQRIAESLPANLDIATQSFAFKNLNARQSTDLLQRIRFPRVSRTPTRDLDPKKLIQREIAELMAKIYMPYFRINRPMLKTGGALMEESLDVNYLKTNLGFGTNIFACFDEAWKIQEQMIRARHEELMAVVNAQDR